MSAAPSALNGGHPDRRTAPATLVGQTTRHEPPTTTSAYVQPRATLGFVVAEGTVRVQFEAHWWETLTADFDARRQVAGR
jgi:hypothetical protein